MNKTEYQTSTTPPADDVREALAFAMFRNEYVYASDAWTESTWTRNDEIRRIYQEKADAILAEFEVHPRGAVGPIYDQNVVGSQIVGHGDGKYETLGHIAAALRRMQADGITENSIRYALGRVF